MHLCNHRPGAHASIIGRGCLAVHARERRCVPAGGGGDAANPIEIRTQDDRRVEDEVHTRDGSPLLVDDLSGMPRTFNIFGHYESPRAQEEPFMHKVKNAGCCPLTFATTTPTIASSHAPPLRTSATGSCPESGVVDLARAAVHCGCPLHLRSRKSHPSHAHAGQQCVQRDPQRLTRSEPLLAARQLKRLQK